jgi:hypothetical protein
MSAIEDEFAFQLDAVGISFVREWHAIKDRRFRYDFWFIGHNVLAEVQGGTWMKGKTGHTSGTGIRRDCEKNNLAVEFGYKCLYFTTDMVRDGSALVTVEKMLNIAT